MNTSKLLLADVDALAVRYTQVSKTYGDIRGHSDRHSRIRFMPKEPSQVALWSHFQTQRPEAFAQARNRQHSLIRMGEKLSRGRSLLNVGCGDGFLEQTAMARGWKVLCVDPDPASIERLKFLGVEARCGTIEALPVDSDSLHLVVCSEVLEHLTTASLAEGLKEIWRVLIPGGVLIGTVPYRENLVNNEVFCPHCQRTFHRWGHCQSFDETKIRDVLAEHFCVRNVRPRYFPQWRALNWKGKLHASGQCIVSLFGVYGVGAKIVFAASKASLNVSNTYP